MGQMRQTTGRSLLESDEEALKPLQFEALILNSECAVVLD